MSHAQKDYPQKLGKSNDTIAESGAFLTAVANLLERFDHDVDPLKLQNFFTIKGMNAAQLTLGAVSVYDPSIGVNRVDNGEPTFGNTIVKMKYQSKLTGKEAITYALVADIEAKTIIDSYDGVVKSWDVYGGPVSFVTFARYNPILVTPLKAPEPTVEPSADTFSVPMFMDGYSSSDDALALANKAGIVNPGAYFVFDTDKDMINLTNQIGKAGLWVNPSVITQADIDKDMDGVVEPEETKTEEPETIVVKTSTLEPSSAVTLVSNEPTSDVFVTPEWQDTYRPGLGEIQAIAIKDIVIKDLSGELPDVTLEKGEIKTIVGKFQVGPQIYFRTKETAATEKWYGIPREDVRRLADIQEEEEELDDWMQSIAEESKNPSQHGKLVKTAATIEGKTRHFLRFKNKKG